MYYNAIIQETNLLQLDVQLDFQFCKQEYYIIFYPEVLWGKSEPILCLLMFVSIQYVQSSQKEMKNTEIIIWVGNYAMQMIKSWHENNFGGWQQQMATPLHSLKVSKMHFPCLLLYTQVRFIYILDSSNSSSFTF